MALLAHGTLTRAGYAVIGLLIASLDLGETCPRAARYLRNASRTKHESAYMRAFPAMSYWMERAR